VQVQVRELCLETEPPEHHQSIHFFPRRTPGTPAAQRLGLTHARSVGQGGQHGITEGLEEALIAIKA
jgi:hypothetical protein